MESSSGTSAEDFDQHDRMIRPIGIIRSCFVSKFGVPRQPGLIPEAWGDLHFLKEFQNPDMLRGLEGFSHVWLIFGFHQTIGQGWNPTVRPPRLGGNERIGTFASRSTFRPNGLGLSVALIEQVQSDSNGESILKLGGIDMVDGTPVYDVKPYLPHSDSLPEADSGYAATPMPQLQVTFCSDALVVLRSLEERSGNIIKAALSLDPRPATVGRESSREFGVTLCGHNIKFKVSGNTCLVTEIKPV